MKSWEKSFNALWIAELVAIAGFATSNPMLPLYLSELGVKDTVSLNWWNGAINASSSAALAIFAPLWGAIADNYGRKLMLLRAIVGGAIIISLLALATSPWQILVLKILQGCVTGTVAAATVLTASIVPSTQVGYRLGLLQMSVFIGNSIGPLFGGYVTELAGSRVNFLATGVLLALSAILVARNVTEEFIPTPKTASIFKNAMPDFSALREAKNIHALLLVILVIQFAHSIASPIIPLVVLDMTETLAGAGSLSGLIIGVASVAGALGAVCTGKISTRIGFSQSLLYCIVGSFVFYLPQGFATEPWHLVVLRFLAGFFMGGTMPAVNALIAQRADRSKQGGIYGISSSVSSIGNALGPIFGALAASTLGYPSVFFTTSVILGALGIGVSRQARKPILS
ncbi:MAG: MFS transporter DHA1 family multidrug resistance protein [Spirochaetes bacterium]|nr:MAG: MFS transporter DHA1 family multidrug resistance protein [Spirochaetota bacterium]